MGFLLVVVAAFLVARWQFSGPRLAGFLDEILFANIRGDVRIGSADWPMLGLTGKYLPVEIRDLEIYDDKGVRVLWIPRITATIDWPAVVFGRHDVTADDVVIHGGRALIRQGMGPEGLPEVGFIAAMKPKEIIEPPPGEPHKPGPIIYLHRLSLSGVAVDLEFENWNAHLRDVSGQGWLRQSFRRKAVTPNDMDFTYGLEARVPYGSVELAKQHFDLVDVHAKRFGQFPNEKDTLAYSASARTIDGADLRIEGKLRHIYDPDPNVAEVELRIDAFEAGLLLSRLSAGYLFGGQAVGTIQIDGKMRAPRLTAEGRGIDLVLPFPLTIDHAALSLDLRTLDLELGHAALSGLRGRAEAHARGNLTATVLSSATVNITEPMSLAPFLPDAVARLAGTELSGQVQLSALPFALHAERLQLTLGLLAVRGAIKLLGGELHVPALVLELPEARASVSGVVVPSTGKLALDASAASPNLPPILERLGLPALARALDVPDATVRGTLEAPVVAGSATVIGLPYTPRLDTSLSYHHATRRLDVRRLAADPLGGTARASGSLVVGRRLRLDGVTLEAERLDLAQLPTDGLLRGVARVRLSASGPAERPRGGIELDVTGLTLGDKPIGTARLRAAADERRGLAIRELTLGGDAGTMAVTGTVGWAPYPLALDVKLDGFPLSSIPEPFTGAGQRRLDLAGRVSAELRLGGDLDRPTGTGRIAVAGLALYDTLLGSGTLRLAEEPGGRSRVVGRLFQNKLAVDASVARGGPLGIDARGRVTLHKVDLDEIFAAEMRAIDAHAWLSGHVDVTTAPALTATLRLSDAHLELDGTDAEGHPAPVLVDNEGEIAAMLDVGARSIVLLQPAVLRSEGGNFTLEGSASEARLAARLRGDVQLRLLELYTRRWLDAARGKLTVDVAVGGSAARPTLDGTIAFADAAVVPRGQEAEVRVPSGELIFSLDRVISRALAVEVDGQRLVLDGSVQLKALKPGAIDATMEGRIAGKVLEMLAPEQITLAGGSAAMRVAIRGTASAPAIQGEIVFDRQLEVSPRALRREIILDSGRIGFSQSQVVVEKVGGSIDDSSLLVSGGATLAPRFRAAVRVDVDGFSHRVPGVLEVELATGLRGVNVTYDDGGLSVRGDIDIVDGRYAQSLQFDRFASNIAFPERTTEVSDPFWKGSDILANMELDLDVQTKGTFAVSNELVNATLSGGLTITGTPPRPVFSGSVESQGEGTVRIPGTKIREFAVTEGRVVFSRYLTFPTSTPTVLLRAEAPFVDLTGTEHRVFLEITGTLSRYDWKLWTSTNLTQAQTMALITFGRVTDDLRARVRGGTPTTVDTSRGPTAAATGSATDEVLNELSGDVIDALIADTLRSLLSLDCFNLSVSGTSVRASACKKLGAIFTLTGQYEQGLGWYRYDAGLTLRPADDLSFVLQQWGLKSVDEASGTQNALRLQLKYNFTLR